MTRILFDMDWNCIACGGRKWWSFSRNGIKSDHLQLPGDQIIKKKCVHWEFLSSMSWPMMRWATLCEILMMKGEFATTILHSVSVTQLICDSRKNYCFKSHCCKICLDKTLQMLQFLMFTPRTEHLNIVPYTTHNTDHMVRIWGFFSPLPPIRTLLLSGYF